MLNSKYSNTSKIRKNKIMYLNKLLNIFSYYISFNKGSKLLNNNLEPFKLYIDYYFGFVNVHVHSHVTV